MPKKMTEEEWKNIDFGTFVSIKEGQETKIKFLTGFWYFQKGEEDFLGNEMRFEGWSAKITLPPDTEERVLTGQIGLQRAMKQEMKDNLISLDDLEEKEPIFIVRRNTKYEWNVRFIKFGIDDKAKTVEKDEDMINDELDLTDRISNILNTVLKDEKSIKKTVAVPLIQMSLKGEDKKDIESALDEVLEGDEYLEKKGDIFKNDKDNEAEIKAEIRKLVKSNKEGVVEKEAIGRMMKGIFGCSEELFLKLLDEMKEINVKGDALEYVYT